MCLCVGKAYPDTWDNSGLEGCGSDGMGRTELDKPPYGTSFGFPENGTHEEYLNLFSAPN